MYTIGQMAALCNVSAEQLRHYDKNGILSPQGRGSENNYRYYTEKQIEDVILIKTLKKVGLPLKTISELVQDKNLHMIKASLENNMMIQRRTLYESLKSYDALVDTLLHLNNAISLIDNTTDAQDRTETNFSIVPIAERPIISTRYESSYNADNTFIYRYSELLNLIEREQVSTTRSIFLIYHEHFDKQFAKKDLSGDLEVFANVTGRMGTSGLYRMFGGFLAGCATYVGHYRGTDRVYRDLTEWVTSIGYTTTGISFQELIVNRMTTNYEDSFVTKIYLPLNVSRI